nr:hypothetical protein [Candidatus Sigynarchaeota archaeon]
MKKQNGQLKENIEHLKTWHSNTEANRLKLDIQVGQLEAVIEMHERIGEAIYQHLSELVHEVHDGDGTIAILKEKNERLTKENAKIQQKLDRIQEQVTRAEVANTADVDNKVIVAVKYEFDHDDEDAAKCKDSSLNLDAISRFLVLLAWNYSIPVDELLREWTACTMLSITINPEHLKRLEAELAKSAKPAVQEGPNEALGVKDKKPGGKSDEDH